MRDQCNLGNPWIGNFDIKSHVFLSAGGLKRGFITERTLCGPLMRLFSSMGKRGLDLLGFRAAPSARLSHYPFEVARALPVQCRVSPSRIVKAVDVFKDGQRGISARMPRLSPGPLGLDCLEDRRSRHSGCPCHSSIPGGRVDARVGDNHGSNIGCRDLYDGCIPWEAGGVRRRLIWDTRAV